MSPFHKLDFKIHTQSIFDVKYQAVVGTQGVEIDYKRIPLPARSEKVSLRSPQLLHRL